MDNLLNREIEQYRNSYANYSDAQLIAEMHQFVSHAAQHIAAKQLLSERETTKASKKHSENMTAIFKATRLSILAIIVALIALAVSIFK